MATKVELKGKLDDVKTSSIYAVIQLLRNAFIQTLVPALDQEVSINSVGEIEKKDDRGFFEKLFNSDDKGRTEAEADTKKGEE